jgi:hypothetical protein
MCTYSPPVHPLFCLPHACCFSPQKIPILHSCHDFLNYHITVSNVTCTRCTLWHLQKCLQYILNSPTVIFFFKVLIIHMREKIQYLSFWVWLILLNMMTSSSIHFPANGMISLFMAEKYSIVYIYHIFSQSSTNQTWPCLVSEIRWGWTY